MSAKQQEHVYMCACMSVLGQGINKNDHDPSVCPHLTVSGQWHATVVALSDGMAAVYMDDSMDSFDLPMTASSGQL